MVTLNEHLLSLKCPHSLVLLFHSLAHATQHISGHLRNDSVTQLRSRNKFGDTQLSVDVIADTIVFEHLKSSKVVSFASSEENSNVISINSSFADSHHFYSVTFDPLDGSSIIDANFAVGSIFSIWPSTNNWIGRSVSDQIAAAVSVYGPRTTMIIAISSLKTLFEITLQSNDQWIVTRNQTSLTLSPDTQYFAPANIRSAKNNQIYRQIINKFIDGKYTLRYSGGLVPDFVHCLIKRQGVFISPVTSDAKAKLRLLYEISAISLITELASGKAVDENGNRLTEMKINKMDQRSGLICGSVNEVDKFVQLQKTRNDNNHKSNEKSIEISFQKSNPNSAQNSKVPSHSQGSIVKSVSKL